MCLGSALHCRAVIYLPPKKRLPCHCHLMPPLHFSPTVQPTDRIFVPPSLTTVTGAVMVVVVASSTTVAAPPPFVAVALP